MLLALYLTSKAAVFIRFAVAIKKSLISNRRARPATIAISMMGTAFFLFSAFADLHHKTSVMAMTLAIIFIVVAGGLFEASLYAAQRASLGFAFSRIRPSRIVTNGPYKWVRHPIYLSYEIYWIGNLLVSRNWMLFCLFGGLSMIYVFAAAQEERILASDPDYNCYRKRSAMIIPYLM